MRTTPTPGESSARSGPASPYAGVAGAPSRAGAARTPGRISLVERQAQYALPSSASRTRPSGGPGASGTSPVARPAVAARRALAAGSAAPSRTAAAPTPSRGLERGLKTPGEKTPATSSRLAKTAAAASPAGARATSVRAKTKSRNDPAAAEPSPPTSPGAESHLGRPLRLRLDAAADADTAQTPGPAAIAHEIPSAPRSRPAREAPPRGAGEESRSAARSPGPPSPSPRSPSPGRPRGADPPEENESVPVPVPVPVSGVSLRPASGSLHDAHSLQERLFASEDARREAERRCARATERARVMDEILKEQNALLEGVPAVIAAGGTERWRARAGTGFGAEAEGARSATTLADAASVASLARRVAELETALQHREAEAAALAAERARDVGEILREQSAPLEGVPGVSAAGGTERWRARGDGFRRGG